jgi:hypothetical protein
MLAPDVRDRISRRSRVAELADLLRDVVRADDG